MDTTNVGDGVTASLPYDLFLDILRRLPSRALAESRRVCHAWRATVDDNGLVLAQFHRIFPPCAFPGVFTNNIKCEDDSYFFRPTASRRSSSRPPRGAAGDELVRVFRYPIFRHDWFHVVDHCNGLLLLKLEGLYCVCNPATIRCAHLPLEPSWAPYSNEIFLAFDPAMSQHHEVLLLPQTMPQLRHEREVKRCLETQQPRTKIFLEQLHAHEPVAEEPKDKGLSLLVFSSQTNHWESREFVPGRWALMHLCDTLMSPYTFCDKIWKSAEYWRGSLYVHNHKNILMILRPTQRTYDLIKLPGIDEYIYQFDLPTRSILASYEKGISYVAIDMFQLQVWELNESVNGQLGWTLTHKANLSPYAHQIEHSLLPIYSMVPWKFVESSKAAISVLDLLGPSYTLKEHGDKEEESGEDAQYSWNSDEDDFIDMDESSVLLSPPENVSCGIIGLHPYKDVILLCIKDNVVAYHLTTSRMQYLAGQLFEKIDPDSCVNRAFPYRPCYVDSLPEGKLS